MARMTCGEAIKLIRSTATPSLVARAMKLLADGADPQRVVDAINFLQCGNAMLDRLDTEVRHSVRLVS